MRRTAIALTALLASCAKSEAPAGGGEKSGSKSGGAKSGGQAGGQRRGPMQFPVEVQKIERGSVEYSVQAIGALEAFEQVQVTARVAGVVDRVDFAEGDEVKQGQSLVEIETKRFQIAVEQARATMTRVDAERKESDAALARRLEANAKSPGLVRAEEIEALRAKVAGDGARAAEAKAQLDLAELNLRDAFVRAPMSGQIETRDVRTGQYVQPGARIATLLRRDPLLLRFAVAENEAAKISKGHELRFSLQDGAEPLRAVVTHIAQAADASTRMVPAIARVDDPKSKALKPGAFAKITVPISSKQDAVIVSETAIRPSERGFIAFVTDGELARERVVTLGLRTLDGRVEVHSGLSVGEDLIVRGGEALTDGAKVRVVTGQGPKPLTVPKDPASGAIEAAPSKKGAP